MRKFQHLFTFFFISSLVSAQIATSFGASYNTPEELLDVMIGSGISYSNVSITNLNCASGYFDGNSNIGFDSGMILATGGIPAAEPGNNSVGLSIFNTDSDISLLLSEMNSTASFLNNLIVLEFDFETASTEFTFDYVFASNEFPINTCGEDVDLFGFLLSGPGITGAYSLGAENIALVPDVTDPTTYTNTSVGINSINSGIENVGSTIYCDNLMLNWSDNSIFYVDNPDMTTVNYPGFTVPLSATAFVSAYTTYHMKIVIADVGNSNNTSALFFDESSFNSYLQYGCTDPTYLEYSLSANTDDGSCATEIVIACPYPYFLEYNPNYTDADVSLCLTIIVEGCMNEDAENFNAEANVDDGTCVVFGCINSAAENYNPEATLQDDSCILYGCTNETADNYNVQSTVDDGTCIIYGCTLSYFPNYNPEATVDDLSCNPVGIEVYGCTDDNALNYISQANTDNGSCLYQEDDSSISIQEEYIPLYLPEGWVLFGYTCLEPLDLSLGFESIVDIVVIVKDSDGNAYLPVWNFNGIGDLIYSRGYQIKTTEEILDFSFCPTITFLEEVSNPQYQLGDLVEGGIVFYIDETGEHGMVAALEDITEGSNMGTYGIPEGFEWGCYGSNVNGVDATSIGTGYQNTLDIVVQDCQTQNGGITAAQATLNYATEGYIDWFLPSHYELVEMYNTIGNGSSLGNIGGFETSDYPYYWSSTEYYNYYAWFVYFNNGSTGYGNGKNGSLRVRAVRAF
jgi:hypothetical protein